MPPRSKAQARFMRAVASGKVKKPGLSREEAGEFVKGYSTKSLPEKKGKKPNNTVRLKVESLSDEDGKLMARLGPIKKDEPSDKPMPATPFVGCTIPIDPGERDYYQPGQHVEIHCVPVDSKESSEKEGDDGWDGFFEKYEEED